MWLPQVYLNQKHVATAKGEMKLDTEQTIKLE